MVHSHDNDTNYFNLSQEFCNEIKEHNIYSGKGVAPSPTPWCSSYRKGSLRVTLDYDDYIYLWSA